MLSFTLFQIRYRVSHHIIEMIRVFECIQWFEYAEYSPIWINLRTKTSNYNKNYRALTVICTMKHNENWIFNFLTKNGDQIQKTELRFNLSKISVSKILQIIMMSKFFDLDCLRKQYEEGYLCKSIGRRKSLFARYIWLSRSLCTGYHTIFGKKTPVKNTNCLQNELKFWRSFSIGVDFSNNRLEEICPINWLHPWGIYYIILYL